MAFTIVFGETTINIIIMNFLVFDLVVSEDFLIFIHAIFHIFQDLCALEQWTWKSKSRIWNIFNYPLEA